MRKITVFGCDTCKREIELEIANDRPYPVRCNITNKCPGLLSAVEQRSSRTELFPPIVYGLQDYIPRGTKISTPTAADPNPNVPLMTGLNSMSIAALELNGAFFSETVFDLNGNKVTKDLFDNQLNIDDPKGSRFDYASSESIRVSLELYELGVDNTTFTEFYYVRGTSTQEVSGIDESPDRLLLRFNLDDNIRVTVNGSELTRNVDFNAVIRPTGERAVVFTPLLSDESNIIRVLVYKEPVDITDPNSPNIRVLDFVGIADGNVKRQEYSWGDSLVVEVDGRAKQVLTCNDLSGLELNNRYQVRGAYVISPVLGNKKYYLVLDKLYLLIADFPYAFVDKSRDLLFSLKTASENAYQLEYVPDVLNNAALQTTQSDLTNLAVPVKITKKSDTTLLHDANDQKNFQNTNISSKHIIGYV
jgi:hypothetical protein